MAEAVDVVTKLDRQISKCRRRLERYDRYYEGEQPLRYMAPALEAEIGDRVTQLVINWPRMCVDAYENRLDMTGFRFRSEDDRDEELWDLFVANDGVAKYTEGHIEHLVKGRFYVIVGAGEDGAPPVFTVEDPLQMAAEHNPRTRQLEAVLKRWSEDDGSQWASLYVPNVRHTFTRKSGKWTEVTDGDIGTDEHGKGLLVTEFLNRGRILRRQGVSEFHDVIPIADAANKMATDMMISGEFHAMPRRWVVGMTAADFVDQDDQQLSTWSAVAGRIWGTKKKPNEVQYGQFPEADLAVFHNTIKVLAQLAGQLMYLPQDYMSFTSDNPTSADAQRATEARMVKRAERMQTTLGSGWKNVALDLLRLSANPRDIENAGTLEVLWRNAATPTVAQTADASVKLVQQDIIDAEQAQEDIGYTPGARKRMNERIAARAQQDLVGSVAELFRRDPQTGQELPNGSTA